MNPKEIGSLDTPPPKPKKSPEPEPEPQESLPEKDLMSESNEGGEDEAQVSKPEEVDEHILVNQEFLLDSDMTVREFLIQNSVEVLDFVRYECGEPIEPTYCQ